MKTWYPPLSPCQRPAARSQEFIPTESDDAANIGVITLSICGTVAVIVFISDIPTIVSQVSRALANIKEGLMPAKKPTPQQFKQVKDKDFGRNTNKDFKEPSRKRSVKSKDKMTEKEQRQLPYYRRRLSLHVLRK